MLSYKLKGLTIHQINMSFIVSEVRTYEISPQISENVLAYILNGVAECINKTVDSDIYLNGTTNILDYPEFGNVAKAKEVFGILDAKELLLDLIASRNFCNDINIQIGSENELEGMKGCSLITATYSLSGIVLGTIAVIGPTRMKYSKVISLMEYLRNSINYKIAKILGCNG